MRNPERALPRHLVIIPDGNGRWAQKHGLPIPEGHIRGGNTLINLAARLKDLGVEVVTFWGFSTENWTRSDQAVARLLEITEKLP